MKASNSDLNILSHDKNKLTIKIYIETLILYEMLIQIYIVEIQSFTESRMPYECSLQPQLYQINRKRRIKHAKL